MKGVSVIIASIIVIIISIAALFLALQMGTPGTDRAKEILLMQEGKDTLIGIDNAVKSVSGEGQGSTRVLKIRVTGGYYVIDTDEEAVIFSMDSFSQIIGVGVSKTENGINVMGEPSRVYLNLSYNNFNVTGGGGFGRGTHTLIVRNNGYDEANQKQEVYISLYEPLPPGAYTDQYNQSQTFVFEGTTSSPTANLNDLGINTYDIEEVLMGGEVSYYQFSTINITGFNTTSADYTSTLDGASYNVTSTVGQVGGTIIDSYNQSGTPYIVEGTNVDGSPSDLDILGEGQTYDIEEGGAGQSASTIYFEGVTDLINGTVYSGTPANLDADDNNYYEVEADYISGGGEPTTTYILPSVYNDVNNKWNNEINAYDINNITFASETQSKVVNDIYFSYYNNTATGTISNVDLFIRWDVSGLDNDYINIRWYVSGLEITSYSSSQNIQINNPNQGNDKVSFIKGVNEPNDGSWNWADIGNLEIRWEGTQQKGPDPVTLHIDEIWGIVTYTSGAVEISALNITHNSSSITQSISDLTELNITLKFESNVTETYYFDIFNWTDSQWYQMQTGSVGTTEVTWQWINDSVVSNFIEATDKVVRIRLRADSTSPFRSLEDLLEFNVSYTTYDYRVEVWHNSTQISYPGTLNSTNVTINFTTTQTDTYSLQIYDWQNSQWTSTGCNPPSTIIANTPTRWWCNETTNPMYYNSSDGIVRIRINSTADSDQGTLKEDYIQYYVGYTTEETYANISVEHNSSTISEDPASITQINITSRLKTNASGISFTLYAYNFTYNDWYQCQQVSIGTSYSNIECILNDPVNFIDNGIIRVRLNSSGDTTTHEMMEDYLVYQITIPSDYRMGVEHNATGVIWSGTLNNISVSVNFSTNVTSTFSLIIYDFNSGNWYSGGSCDSGSATENTWYMWWCNMTTNPEYYNSSDNKIRIRLNNTAHSNPAKIQEDYVQYYVTYTT